MSFDPLLAAPWHVQLHAFAALGALALGIVQVIAPKGTLPHRTVGTLWVLLIAAVTISSAFIIHPREPGEPFLAHFTWIHLLTLVTAFSLTMGTLRILRGGPNLKRHAGFFMGIFIFGLIIAGVFAFTPGRIMYAVLFGGEAETLEYLEAPSWYFLPGSED